jgi:RNA polymerase sigma-70 factor (sigma-E family)
MNSSLSTAGSDAGAVERSFEMFVVDHGAALVAFAYRLTFDFHYAEDAVQEAMARCGRSWSRIAAVDNPRAYVYRAVINEVRSWQRRRWHSQEIPVHDDVLVAGDRTGQVADDSDTDEALRAALHRVPYKRRAALVLRYYVGLSDREIAETLGCSEVTVRSQIHRGLATLRTLLDSPHPDRTAS